MTHEQFSLLTTAASEGLMPDDLNAAYIFSTTNTELLSLIAKGVLSAQEIAKRTLESRGLDINGKWAGFKSEIK